MLDIEMVLKIITPLSLGLNHVTCHILNGILEILDQEKHILDLC